VTLAAAWTTAGRAVIRTSYVTDGLGHTTATEPTPASGTTAASWVMTWTQVPPRSTVLWQVRLQVDPDTGTYAAQTFNVTAAATQRVSGVDTPYGTTATQGVTVKFSWDG
jgi:hypothetical protein